MQISTTLVIVIAVVVVAVIAVIALLASKRSRLRPLSDDAKLRYAGSWRAVEARFIEDPAAAVAEADSICVMLLRERGARLDDDRHLPRELAEARTEARSQRGQGTEGLRHAMLRYQAILDDAVGESLRKQETRRPEVA